MPTAHISPYLDQTFLLTFPPERGANYPALSGQQKGIADSLAERLVFLSTLSSGHITIILPEEMKDTFLAPKLQAQMFQFLQGIAVAPLLLNTVQDLPAADINGCHRIIMLPFILQRGESGQIG